MNSKQVVNGLAVLGAIVVMVGVMFAATSALADESAAIVAWATAMHEPADRREPADQSLDAASRAHEVAAADAAARIAMSNRIDLDIRFFDHRSVAIADGR